MMVALRKMRSVKRGDFVSADLLVNHVEDMMRLFGPGYAEGLFVYYALELCPEQLAARLNSSAKGKSRRHGLRGLRSVIACTRAVASSCGRARGPGRARALGLGQAGGSGSGSRGKSRGREEAAAAVAPNGKHTKFTAFNPAAAQGKCAQPPAGQEKAYGLYIAGLTVVKKNAMFAQKQCLLCAGTNHQLSGCPKKQSMYDAGQFFFYRRQE
jgi:hypothetical protein